MRGKNPVLTHNFIRAIFVFDHRARALLFFFLVSCQSLFGFGGLVSEYPEKQSQSIYGKFFAVGGGWRKPFQATCFCQTHLNTACVDYTHTTLQLEVGARTMSMRLGEDNLNLLPASLSFQSAIGKQVKFLFWLYSQPGKILINLICNFTSCVGLSITNCFAYTAFMGCSQN